MKWLLQSFSLWMKFRSNLYNKAANFRTENTTEVKSYDEFKEVLNSKGGFILAHWDGTSETEEKIKERNKSNDKMYPFRC